MYFSTTAGVKSCPFTVWSQSHSPPLHFDNLHSRNSELTVFPSSGRFFGFCQAQNFRFVEIFWMQKGQCGVPAGLQCSLCVTPLCSYLSTFNPQFPKWKRKWNHWCHWSNNLQVEWNIDALRYRSIQYQAMKIRKKTLSIFLTSASTKWFLHSHTPECRMETPHLLWWSASKFSKVELRVKREAYLLTWFCNFAHVWPHP